MIEIDFTIKSEIVPDYVVDIFGHKCLYDKNGKLHSYNDLPAAVIKDGTKFWYKHGKRHRDNNLPAVIYLSGRKAYWLNGKYIRSE